MADEYIKRSDAIMAVTRAKLPDTTPEGVPIANGKRSVTDCVRRIKEIPTADVAPVRHGRWEEVEIRYWDDMDEEAKEALAIASMFCPKCKRYHNEVYIYGNPTENVNYCPNCGAKMDGEA